ncbi:MAG: family 1 glycosylhydrolase [Hyphomonadaceae bacterium]|nr:family 1 glycosylhydrolase [Hyphomonadaceae bacterium]
MIQLWGGHECTVNRVGDVFYDQTARSGHQDRPADLDLFASLGLARLRYPVLWERVAPDEPERCDWRWSDARLGKLQTLGLQPIVGLLHHGSGPGYTNLLNPNFPSLFAAYARRVAERYPWVLDWTPINEPLTTARFSALYGLWYPHRTDEQAFWLALINQIEGVQLAMAAIREVTPSARLIQTEDLGHTYATPPVAAQAQFDNSRRWMTWDLLCGHVGPQHHLWPRLESFGFAKRLRNLAAAPSPPNILGLNHYLTSDRFLDHRVLNYPPERRGGNSEIAFADVEAIRVMTRQPTGLEGALTEAWQRYGLPLAVTECHNGCTREEQVRWLREAWDTARRLQKRGVGVQAVTSWSLLGSHDWCSLLTRADGHYEVGAFDIRGPAPRPTAVATEIKRLTKDPAEPHPATLGPGWWRRDARVHFPVGAVPSSADQNGLHHGVRRLLITGATGVLGQALARACRARGIAYRLTSRRDLDLADDAAIARVLDAERPWGVINAAGWVRVDEAECAADACHAANAGGARRLAKAAVSRGVYFVGISSDLVFDGQKRFRYVESDPTRPLNVYGVSKRDAEKALLALGGPVLIARTAAFFSPEDPHNFAAQLVLRLNGGQPFEAADDLVVSPTYVPDLVDALLDLAIDGEVGVRHLVNEGEVTWASFARAIAIAADLDPSLVRETPHAQLGWAAPRPMCSALGTIRGQILPSLDSAIGRFVHTLHAQRRLSDRPAVVAA